METEKMESGVEPMDTSEPEATKQLTEQNNENKLDSISKDMLNDTQASETAAKNNEKPELVNSEPNSEVNNVSVNNDQQLNSDVEVNTDTNVNRNIQILNDIACTTETVQDTESNGAKDDTPNEDPSPVNDHSTNHTDVDNEQASNHSTTTEPTPEEKREDSKEPEDSKKPEDMNEVLEKTPEITENLTKDTAEKQNEDTKDSTTEEPKDSETKEKPESTKPSEVESQTEKSPSQIEDDTESVKNIEDTSQSAEDTSRDKFDDAPKSVDKGTESADPDEQSMNEDDVSMEENPIFVQVNAKDKEGALEVGQSQETSEDVVENVEEDPIGVSCQIQIEKDETMDFEETILEKDSPMKVVDKNVIEDLVSGKGADEELCIIPDTERVISQEEKDAATRAKTNSSKLSDDDDKSNESIRERAPAEEQKMECTISVVNHVSENLEEKIFTKVTENERKHVCGQCNLLKKCHFKALHTQKPLYICNNICLDNYKGKSKNSSRITEPAAAEKELTQEEIDQNKIFVRKCSECLTRIVSPDEKILTWETMEFCHEECLVKYQTKIGSHCANCSKNVAMGSLGKYCVRFGHDIRQFCCSTCLEEFKKGLKVCSYCQKDISIGAEGFLAPVGDKGQFKDFCSQNCMENFDIMSNKNSNRVATVSVGVCSVCTNEKPLPIKFEKHTVKHQFCSEPCFVAFKFVNNVDPLFCDMCKKYFENNNSAEFSIYCESGVKNFCSKTCQNIHIIANRRIVPCSWCKVKKYNFDMIKRTCNTGQILNMCSLNCLSLFQVSVNAVNSKKLKCDFCSKTIQAQYHLTMSDATLKNFCSYHCVISFQNQYTAMPMAYGPDNRAVPTPAPTPIGPARRNYSRNSRANDTEVQMPVITNVQSLANQTDSQDLTPNSCQVGTTQTAVPVPPPPVQVKQQVIIKPPPRPLMKNKICSTRPIMKTKAVSCKVNQVTKATQTDKINEKVRIIPIPVPMYIPSPMHMFSRPLPVPVPFPLPIPVPMFIPTTRNSAAGIMKEIKKIQVKIPTDPFEAELLMMAEMVAGEKKIDHTDSESEEDDHGGSAEGGFSPEAVDTSNTFGDDMLQMALKMATELDEPAVDLEGALTASTITATQSSDSGVPEETVDDPQPLHAHHHSVLERGQPLRGRKRTVRQVRGGAIIPAKRGRRISSNVDMPLMPPPQPAQPPEPVEKPDANMCLKYTFGVNAWKQWVTTKNAELEKSSRRMKLFKNEILQLTADELNYSLCLFVKEVRKPNGTEYAPDTIYYLCLGIQQYLFENGRIDNIFTDAYYEKFTDCLDEVARKFSVLYNDSHYIVTRVEEEHLWESKQLGAHSPHVLLSTLMFFNTKHFNLTTVDEHMQLSFSHIMKHWKRNPNQPGAAKVSGSRNVLLRFYPPQSSLAVADNNARKKKVYEQQENEENPLRCPVKLYEFYLSKCPESVKTRNDVFYLLPERSCVPDSPVWYSTMALGREALEKMLHRVKMVKEINVALLTS